MPALLLLIVDSAIRTELLSAFALVLCLPGISLLLLGTRRTKQLGFAFFLALFMLPIPSAFVHTLVMILRRISAAGAEQVVSLFGIPILRDYTTLHLPSISLEIVDACSGFSTLYASYTVALILCFLNSDPVRRILLLLAAGPLAVVCNILRCGALALMAHYEGSKILDTWLHPLTGIISFWLTLALLLLFSRNPTHRSPA